MNVGAEPSARSKREMILRVASDEFGRNGFDATKWAQIAEPAGIGNTALYHYFESKTHCLFTLLLESYEGWETEWRGCLLGRQAALVEIDDAVATTFRCSEAEAIKNRLHLHEQGKLSTLSCTGRTQETQAETMHVARRIEKLWISYLTTAMAQGELPEQNPRALAHAIIGLLQSVWGWYRPGGPLTLDDLGTRYRGYVRAMVLAV